MSFRLLQVLLGFVLLLGGAASAQHAPTGDAAFDAAMASLRLHFAESVQRAESLTSSGNRDNWFLYANEGGSAPEDFLGNAIAAIGENQRIMSRFYGELISTPGDEPGNDIQIRAALKWIETRLAAGCRFCETLEDRAKYREAAAAFVESFDVQGARTSYNNAGGFSGLPFFHLVRKRLQDPAFVSRVKAFDRAMIDLVDRAAKNPDRAIETTAYQEALRICDGNGTDATELVGILLARDVNVRKYFEHVEANDRDLMFKMGRAPALVRLLAELDRNARKTELDRFSYDGRYQTKNVKNYYFWGAALNSLELRRKKIDERSITDLSAEWARQYKVFRSIEMKLEKVQNWFTGNRPAVEAIAGDEFYRDAVQVMRNSASGARFGFNAAGFSAPMCSKVF